MSKRGECVKCGGTWITKRYVDFGAEAWVKNPDGSTEYLRWTCDACGYSWTTPTKDRAEARKDAP